MISQKLKTFRFWGDGFKPDHPEKQKTLRREMPLNVNVSCAF